MRIGDYVGPYRLVRLVAQGGMGAVYEAKNEGLSRRVAIKLLHASLAADPEQNLRFVNEARVANLVNHPSLVTIHEYGTIPGGCAYIVMEYLDGQTLGQRLRSRGGEPLPIAQTVRIARQVAAALCAAHDLGVVHRDLKPDNLMLVRDPEVPGGERVKILDFGIAKVKSAGPVNPDATRIGVGMGTPGYVAPEQVYGASSVDGRADVYSLGIILYELICGSRPFLCKNPEQEVHYHLTRQPPPLLDKAPGTPRPLAALVHYMLGKQPEQRPTMREVADHLHTIEYSTPGSVFVGQKAPRPVSIPAVLGTAAVTMLVSGAFLFLGMQVGGGKHSASPRGSVITSGEKALPAPSAPKPERRAAAAPPDLGAAPPDLAGSVARGEDAATSGGVYVKIHEKAVEKRPEHGIEKPIEKANGKSGVGSGVGSTARRAPAAIPPLRAEPSAKTPESSQKTPESPPLMPQEEIDALLSAGRPPADSGQKSAPKSAPKDIEDIGADSQDDDAKTPSEKASPRTSPARSTTSFGRLLDENEIYQLR
jgi:serine/threonine-protein kinase